MNNCEHTHHHDMEFNQCIHMHKVEPIKCGTDENCDIKMVAAGESFATAGSSVWTLVKKIGCMIENAKNAILEKVNAIGEKINNINITVEGTASDFAESETKASQRHETVVYELGKLSTGLNNTADKTDVVAIKKAITDKEAGASMPAIQLALDNLQLALQGNNPLATLTAIKSIVENIPTATYGDALDAIQQVVNALPKTTLTEADKQEILNAIAGVTPTVDFTSVLNAISASETAIKEAMPSIPTDYARQGAKAKTLDDIQVDIPKGLAMEETSQQILEEVKKGSAIDPSVLEGIAKETQEFAIQEAVAQLKQTIGDDSETHKTLVQLVKAIAQPVVTLTDEQAEKIAEAVQQQVGGAPTALQNAEEVWKQMPNTVATDTHIKQILSTMAAYMTALISYFGAAQADRKAKHLVNLDEHAATRSLISDKHADLAANLGDPVMEGGKSLRELVGWEQAGGKSVAELVAETLQSVKLLSADPTPLSKDGINLILQALGIATDDTLAGYEFLSEQECRDMINEAWSTTFGKADPADPSSKDFQYICDMADALLYGDIQQSAQDAVEELMERLRSPLPA